MPPSDFGSLQYNEPGDAVYGNRWRRASSNANMPLELPFKNSPREDERIDLENEEEKISLHAVLYLGPCFWVPKIGPQLVFPNVHNLRDRNHNSPSENCHIPDFQRIDK